MNNKQMLSVLTKLKHYLTPPSSASENARKGMFHQAQALMAKHGIKPQELGRREAAYAEMSTKWGSA